MNIEKISTLFSVLLLSLVMTLPLAGPALAQSSTQSPSQVADDNEPQHFNAFAVVAANGSVTRTGEKQAIVVALLSGSFFVETGEGPIHTGSISCPGLIKIDLGTTRQTASGACTVSTTDGATAWGEWECAGYSLVGCRGTYKVTGGTERFSGAIGESTLIWRPSAHELKKQLDGSVLQNTSGLIVFHDFKLSKK
jgi:hypothetical protein